LPQLRPAAIPDLMSTIERFHLYSRGIGLVDAGLLTALPGLAVPVPAP